MWGAGGGGSGVGTRLVGVLRESLKVNPMCLAGSSEKTHPKKAGQVKSGG